MGSAATTATGESDAVKAARTLRALCVAASLLACAGARAQPARESSVPLHEIYPSCAGDGLPPPLGHRERRVPYSVQLSALVQGWGAAVVGRDARQTDLDAVSGSGLYLGAARLGACGLLGTTAGPISWNVIYEPYALDEAAEPDGRVWGRLAAAEIGFAPFRWLTLSVGVRKVALSFGHDEPLQLRALPIIPYSSQSVAPDRRAGITVDDDFGVAHVVLGLYQGARDLTITADGGFLIAARLVAEPIGPVGNHLTTLGDPASWRKRPRIAINASILIEYQRGNSYYALGADGVLHWGPLGLVGEYLYDSGTRVESPVRHLPRAHAARQGTWIEAAVMAWRPWIEAALRYDWLDYGQIDYVGPAGQHYRQCRGGGDCFHAITAGLNVYAFRQYLKVQALYTSKFHYGIAPNAPLLKDDIFLIAAQLGFERRF